MMKAETTTTFAGEQYGVRANWAQAADPVEAMASDGTWVPTHYQVADFHHSDTAALRKMIEESVIAGGDTPEDYTAEINEAIAGAE
ncbi:MAG: hypothetical protein ACYSX1_11085 [Planctomycetota bacterium]|jgi:hypothetical protein